MRRLSFVFFVAFSSNIFCVKVNDLLVSIKSGAGKNSGFFYCPSPENYKKALDTRSKELAKLGNTKPANGEEEKKRIEADFHKVYNFDLDPGNYNTVRDVLTFFQKECDDDKFYKKYSLSTLSSFGFDIKSCKFNRLTIIHDKKTRKSYSNLDDNIELKEGVSLYIFVEKEGSPVNKGGGCCCCKGKRN